MKKVAKHENKFAKLQSQAAKYQFRNQLKTVKKQEYTLKEQEEGVSGKTTCVIIDLNSNNSINASFSEFNPK